MIAQVIKNRYKTQLIQADISVLEAIKSPFTFQKEECPLWKFVTLKDGSKPERCGENFDKVLAIELDFDAHIFIQDFKKKYEKFEFYLYTTSSHVKGLNEKFRVIIPLAEPILYSMYQDKILIESLAGLFKGVDKSCFKNFHNMPNKPSSTKDYEYFYNKGELFSFKLLETDYQRRVRDQNLDKSMRKTRNSSKNSDMSKFQKIKYKEIAYESIKSELNSIPQGQTGSRYNNLLSVCGKLCSAKYPTGGHVFDEDEIRQTILNHTDDKNVRKMIVDLVRKR